MTQDEIIEMAVQAGMAEEIAEVNIDIVESFAKLVAAKAIAELESQEPVAWADMGTRDVDNDAGLSWTTGHFHTTPLYTHPLQRTWVGLTHEETSGFTQHEMSVVKYVNKVLQEKNT
jgi:hypothetical protein